eukprot:CAMPEP_0184719070 /NCGR_PEP_ID=MMETSP0314-20130426/8089_1 /TAXON_ID=38298 /ORGANISM="Rhodella maculata, Strain CCMP 736" /LENGTH=103 /DNA_ID=CAMNT_0027182911 /DNA_START=39 /DNA_END=349 /DNA_ORIENTATION=-
MTHSLHCAPYSSHMPLHTTVGPARAPGILGGRAPDARFPTRCRSSTEGGAGRALRVGEGGGGAEVLVVDEGLVGGFLDAAGDDGEDGLEDGVHWDGGVQGLEN